MSRQQSNQQQSKQRQSNRSNQTVGCRRRATTCGEATVAADWDEWYKQIAKEIYRQWERSAVCPGKATVCVSVYNSRDVDSQIINFESLSTDKVNASNQSAFCQAAIESVDHLNRYQFWQFPANASARMRKVKLNIEFKREVGGKPAAKCQRAVDLVAFAEIGYGLLWRRWPQVVIIVEIENDFLFSLGCICL